MIAPAQQHSWEGFMYMLATYLEAQGTQLLIAGPATLLTTGAAHDEVELVSETALLY